MDLQLLADELEPQFTEPYLEAEGVTVLAPPVPIDLEVLSADLYPDECDEENAYEVVGDVAGLVHMIRFSWEEDGAKPFHAALDLMALGDYVYLTIAPDEAIDQSWEAVAAMVDYRPTVLDPLLLDLLADNGTRLGVDILSSLPTRVETKLIQPLTLLRAFRRYLDWDDERNPGAWEVAAGYLPAKLRDHDRLVEAARRVAAGETGEIRDEFLAAYVVATFSGEIKV